MDFYIALYFISYLLLDRRLLMSNNYFSFVLLLRIKSLKLMQSDRCRNFFLADIHYFARVVFSLLYLNLINSLGLDQYERYNCIVLIAWPLAVPRF